jgi:hypothetical protein
MERPWGRLGLVLGKLPESPCRARRFALEHGVEGVWGEARQCGLEALLSYYLPEVFSLPLSARVPRLFAAARLERGTIEIQSILAKAGIGALVFKGLAVAAKYYPEPWLRPASDIDMIVRPADVRGAVSALEADDWKVVRGLPSTKLEFSNHVVLTKGQRQRLELHFAPIADFQARIDVERLFERAERVCLEGKKWLMAPQEADHFVLLAAHLIHHARSHSVKWFFDLKLMLRARPDWNWNAVVESACANGVKAATGVALRELVRLGVGVPGWVLDSLGPGIVRRRVVDAVRSRSGADVNGLFSSVALADRFSSGLVIEVASRPFGRFLTRIGLGAWGKRCGRKLGLRFSWIRSLQSRF